MSRLVVVSNRVANLEKAGQSGGLAVALVDALKARGGLWFGWNGKTVGQGTRVPPDVNRFDGITTATLPLTRKDYNEYYAGLSNNVLWPLLHYRLDLVDYKPEYLRGYKRVNSKFADALAPLLRDDDTIWVHDYHLIPLGAELRKRGHRRPIGFFLHIPFSPPEIIAAAPQNEWLVRCLLAYDVVGFQTHTDLANFRQYVVEQGFGTLLDDTRIATHKRTVVARCFPIGIDVQAFRDMAFSPAADEQIARLRRVTLDRRQIIGVDRLDYSKGLPDRMRAFRKLLQLFPDTAKTVSFIQIAPPTREDVEAYSDIRVELERLSGSINGEYSDYDWTPLRYIHRPVERRALAALFRASQVGFVSPLRDGMNLVAKEYVAAQDDEDPGVLVLSKFAGAAEDLREALIVNPYNVDEMAHALHTALTMPVEERRHRQHALFARVRERDARAWQSAFLDALEAAGRGGTA